MPDDRAVLYLRQLPGGGYVSIEARDDGPASYWGGLCVERRSLPDRRDGHPPPIVLEASGPTQEAVFETLIRIADSNVAVASALQKWEAARG